MWRYDESQLQTLARFSQAPEGRLLVELLRAKLIDRDTKLRTATGEEVLRAQGRALELAELIDDITSAPAKLNRPRPTATSPLRPVA